MSAHGRIPIGLRLGTVPFYSLPNPLRNQILKFPRMKTLMPQMVTQCGANKRPTCPACSKPTRICLCVRLKTPSLDNSVAVTIFQQSLEKKHPLNSARIATLGLRNVDVISVSDVNFQAHFLIRLLDASYKMGRSHLLGQMQSERKLKDHVEESISANGDLGFGFVDFDGQYSKRSDFDGVEMDQICKNGITLSECIDSKLESGGSRVVSNCYLDERAASRSPKATAIDFTIEKHGAIRSFYHCSMNPNKWQKVNFDALLASDVAVGDIRKGFVVKRLLRKPLDGSNVYQESEEFEAVVPPGSVLLFPSENSVGIESLDFEVRNLIVLDGTWAKAKRLYSENPWLKLLPHLRLDLDKLSLYSEVRHQPRAGYLSTIESIVYAMKALGEDSEGLDSLLNVFESMVGDQRRCKDERLNKASEL
ncbi:DTW domain-containing protein [Forsythia ovata]|uniref:tRNA-uridine aminocarboxypropyltransferase n=1 Tax=Forsythia ovata TaxID=205694 RepID=A0ABD1S6D8_9LAMI